MSQNKIRAIFNEIDPIKAAMKKKKMLQLYFNETKVKLNLDGSKKFQRTITSASLKALYPSFFDTKFENKEGGVKLRHILGKDTLVEDKKPIFPNSLNPGIYHFLIYLNNWI